MMRDVLILLTAFSLFCFYQHHREQKQKSSSPVIMILEESEAAELTEAKAKIEELTERLWFMEHTQCGQKVYDYGLFSK